jgi:hypothetical protein
MPSALLLNSDIARRSRHFAFVPERDVKAPDYVARLNTTSSFVLGNTPCLVNFNSYSVSEAIVRFSVGSPPDQVTGLYFDAEDVACFVQRISSGDLCRCLP